MMHSGRETPKEKVNQTMKAISLWQPWASAMASGVKQNETRSWWTNYRGDLVICSAKRRPSRQELPDRVLYEEAMAVPYGCALCIVELHELIPSDLFHGATPLPISQAEADLGDYTPGRWIWRTRNCRRLHQAVPIVGHQGLWNLTDSEVARINLALHASNP